ncbi:hypothetical protein [Mycobacterium colombiense]
MDHLTAQDGPAIPDVLNIAAPAFRRLGIDFVRRYNRLDIAAAPNDFGGPVLFVANHGFGESSTSTDPPSLRHEVWNSATQNWNL